MNTVWKIRIIRRRKDGSTFPVVVSSRGAEIQGERLLLSIIRGREQLQRILNAALGR